LRTCCLGAAILKALLKEKGSEAAILRSLTAFTHPRRLTIMTQLQAKRILSFESLIRETGISSPALYRHLAKLEARGIVCTEGGA
jgi:DNA-binding transcriptional ArsR family regulator